MTAGASRAATKITSQPALAPSPQPRPAPTGRALIAQNVGKGGPFRMPIRGPDWMPIDSHDAALVGGEPTTLRGAEIVAVAAEDVRNLQLGAHWPALFGRDHLERELIERARRPGDQPGRD